MFSKTCTFPYFYILSRLFLEQFSPPFFPAFFILSFPLPQLDFHTPYPQSKILLNIRVVPSSAILCSNAVLITTPSSSMHFFSFFDMLPSAPATTGMTLMLLIFRVLLIYLFSSWYRSIFSFSFSLTLAPGRGVSIMA